MKIGTTWSSTSHLLQRKKRIGRGSWSCAPFLCYLLTTTCLQYPYSTLGANADPLSKYVDKEFDGAYNLSLINEDLPNVRFGRIDYLTVTRLTTRWFVWKCVSAYRSSLLVSDLGYWRAPIFVVAHNRGRVLRFFRHNEIRLSAENLHKFLSLGAWTEIPTWDGPFAPGGDL